jgi:uncharacterized protein involved in exopolysaccharide biosynthesis
VPLIFSCGEKNDKEEEKEQTTYEVFAKISIEGDANLENQKAILKSYELAEKTILDLGIDTNTVSLEELTKNYVLKLKVNHVSKESTVLELSIEDESKEIINYLKTLIDIHAKEELKKKNLSATNTLNYIKSQIPKTKATLDTIQNKLKEFKEKNPDMSYKDYGAILQKQEIEESFSQYQIHLSYYNELLLYLQDSNNIESIVLPTSVGISNPELQKLILTLIELKAEQKTLELSATENHPKYQSLESEINHSKQSIIENIKNLITSTNSAKRELKERIDVFDKEIEQLPEREKNYIKLYRDRLDTEEFYAYLTNVENEMNLAITKSTEDIRVIEYARFR